MAQLTIKQIQEVVAFRYGRTREDLIAHNNRPQFCRPRGIAMYICRVHADATFTKIAREFGHRHHTTVITAIEQVKQRYRRDSRFHVELFEIASGLFAEPDVMPRTRIELVRLA